MYELTLEQNQLNNFFSVTSYDDYDPDMVERGEYDYVYMELELSEELSW